MFIGQLCAILGASIYKKYGRDKETRTMVIVAISISALGSLLQFFFAKRWNLEVGISDIVFLLFTDVVFSILGVVFFALPVFSFIAKVTPPKVEGTIYATLSGFADFAFGVMSPLVASFIN